MLRGRTASYTAGRPSARLRTAHLVHRVRLDLNRLSRCVPVINAVIWRVKTGAQWRELPERRSSRGSTRCSARSRANDLRGHPARNLSPARAVTGTTARAGPSGTTGRCTTPCRRSSRWSSSRRGSGRCLPSWP
ncbi:hypothetical protein D7X32_06815 [Corallococcus carmarthensis]|uniref:Transposase n=1 Tax=Corallococcus carmarthensis TaxID=2316728 RepID=A0A3A8KF77_9BACT|nr:hypothetical protein D7X32_06815 [Corallococcus carmarthensis]